MKRIIRSATDSSNLLTLNEVRKMNYMGWKYIARFKRPNGVMFTKYFNTEDEMNDFIDGAKDYNVSLVKYQKLEK